MKPRGLGAPFSRFFPVFGENTRLLRLLGTSASWFVLVNTPNVNTSICRPGSTIGFVR
jgi:hypothetical protein